KALRVVAHCTRRIGEMEEDQPPDHGVEAALIAVVADVALDETDVLEAGVGRPFLRDLEQPGLGVDADDLAGRPHERRDQPGDVAEPGPQVEHAHPGLDAGTRQEARCRRLVERRLRVEPGDLVLLASQDVRLRLAHRRNSGTAETRAAFCWAATIHAGRPSASRVSSSTCARSRSSSSSRRPSSASRMCARGTANSPPTTRAPAVRRTLRSSSCAPTPPNEPVLVPNAETGLLAIAAAPRGRDVQSIAFLSWPGIDALYSGVAIRIASARATASRSRSTAE